MQEEKTEIIQMLPNEIARLVALMKINSLSLDEKLALAKWRQASVVHEDAFQYALARSGWKQDLVALDAFDTNLALQNVLGSIQTNQKKATLRLRYRYLSLAAAILLVFGCGLLFYKFSNPAPVILPGTNKAILTLSGGATVSLSEGQQEIIIDDALLYGDGTRVDGLLGEAADAEMMEISTPKGGEYSIVLADQTKVVLNANSRLRFPRRFTEKERVVELLGEGYFEVSHRHLAQQKAQPFIVKTSQQTIRVLGTHFNISAYADQNETQTTLLEGAVSVASTAEAEKAILLSPGQQAYTKVGEALKVKTVDTYNYIAWTKNQFIFTAEPLSSVMQKVGRWYDLDYEFRKESHRTETIEGILPRYASVEELLRLLQESKNIRFKLEGRKIIIY